MLIDSAGLEPRSEFDADVCVIGAGAAGIALARALDAAGRGVLLLESGGLEVGGDAQQLNRGEIGGLPYAALETARLRGLGGTTNHWSGWCRPLDPMDFEKRPWVAGSGWPLTRDALDPYYRRAFEVVRAGPGAEPVTDSDPDAVGIGLRGTDVENLVFWLSPPARFGTLYRDELATSQRVRLVYNATVTTLVRDSGDESLARVEAIGRGGRRISVRARAFVLAAGGIENPRLMLAAAAAGGTGIGDAHGLVGRYFMDHAGIAIGTAMLRVPEPMLRFYRRHLREVPTRGFSAQAIGGIRVRADACRRGKMLNSALLLEETDRSEAFGLRGLSGAETSTGEVVDRAAEFGDELIADVWQRVFDRERAARFYRVVSVLEPSPNPSSRVVLIPERDPLGVPRVRLEWRLNSSDRDSAQATGQLLGRALGSLGLGRMLVGLPKGDWPPQPQGRVSHGWHHMGTTRMHEDPRQGVVDGECRVHGCANLFVAGSSVFPTYGYAQPTLTIVALALRLADTLTRETAA
jgi:choline dehydrogenase-like flavoprotein